jgi:hypothetical protein
MATYSIRGYDGRQTSRRHHHINSRTTSRALPNVHGNGSVTERSERQQQKQQQQQQQRANDTNTYISNNINGNGYNNHNSNNRANSRPPISVPTTTTPPSTTQQLAIHHNNYMNGDVSSGGVGGVSISMPGSAIRRPSANGNANTDSNININNSHSVSDYRNSRSLPSSSSTNGAPMSSSSSSSGGASYGLSAHSLNRYAFQLCALLCISVFCMMDGLLISHFKYGFLPLTKHSSTATRCVCVSVTPPLFDLFNMRLYLFCCCFLWL